MAEKAKKKAKKTAKKKAVKKTKTKTSAKKKAKTAVAKKATKKKVAKKQTAKKAKEVEATEISKLESPPLEEKFFESSSQGAEGDHTVAAAAEPENTNGSQLRLNLSKKLIKKLKNQAEEEGITLEEFVSELLSESVVLRAWEIVERKNQMRSMPSQNMGNRSGNVGNSGGARNNNRKNRGGMSHGRYQSIMDDKATFLEYVRNQERTRR